MLLTSIKNLLFGMMVQQSSGGCSGCIAGDSVNSPFVAECSNCE